jgi:hypothetical protein
VSIYASSFELSNENSADDDAPIVYQGSHILPSNQDPRAGRLDLACIPGHIARTGRPALHDGESEDWPYHPWLRMGAESTDPELPAEQRRYVDFLLDREQVTALYTYLGQWLRRTAPAEKGSS